MPIYRKGGSGLPAITAGDALKILRVKSDESGMELAAVPVELPAPTTGDAGKVLAVTAEEDGYELQAPSTGGADEAAVLSLLDFLGH
jgi:hypothetical protein